MNLRSIVAKRIAFNKKANKEFLDIVKNKLKIPLPTEKEAIEILGKYAKDEKDIEKAYSLLPKIVNFFKSKKSFDVKSDFSVLPPGFFKGLIIIVAMVAIAGGILPKNNREAEAKLSNLPLEQYVALEQLRTDFNYLGTLRRDGVSLIVADAENMKDALNILRKALGSSHSRDKMVYKGYVPVDDRYLIYKDKNGKEIIRNLEELKNLGKTVYLGYH